MVQSVKRAFEMLEYFTQHETLSLAQLCEQMQLTKTTAHRFVTTLIELGYVEKTSSNTYRLTIKLFEMGNKQLQLLDSYSVLKSMVISLAKGSEETVHMVIEDDGEILYIDKVTVNEVGLEMRSKIGMRAPMYCTAVGKALLATKSDREIERYWKRITPIAYTKKTKVSYEELLKEIYQIRRQGYALDDEEFEEGILCVGVAFATYQKNGAGAFSMSLQSSNRSRLDQLIPEILETSKKLTSVLGGVRHHL